MEQVGAQAMGHIFIVGKHQRGQQMFVLSLLF